jgi:outer membrane lipoprotein-sorting protein
MMIFTRFSIGLFFFISFIFSQAFAQISLEKIDHYFSSIQALKSRFIQINPDDTQACGWLYWLRPGKIRLDYDPPLQIHLISNGVHFAYVDPELDQISYGSLPQIWRLLLENTSLQSMDGLEFTPLTRHEAALSLMADEGRLTLYFTDNPLQLHEWSILDEHHRFTRVILYELDRNPTLAPELFFLPSKPINPNQQ